MKAKFSNVAVVYLLFDWFKTEQIKMYLIHQYLLYKSYKRQVALSLYYYDNMLGQNPCVWYILLFKY